MRFSRSLRLTALRRLAPLGAAVLLAGCASLAPSPTASPTATVAPTVAITPTQVTATVTCREWRAWHDSMPGKEPTLYVVGKCDLPTPGHAVALQRKAPQGINPRDLLLEMIVTPPSGAVAQVITTVEARYEEKTAAEYDTVTVLPDGVTVRVDETS